MQTLLLSLEERDAEELVLVLRGYHKLFTDRALPVHRERSRWTQDSGNLSLQTLIHRTYCFLTTNYIVFENMYTCLKSLYLSALCQYFLFFCS